MQPWLRLGNHAGDFYGNQMNKEILTLLSDRGDMTAADLVTALGKPESSVRCAITNLMFARKIESVANWNGAKRYCLPTIRPFPAIGATEYRFIAPSGSLPQSICGVLE